MSIAETDTSHRQANGADKPAGKILQFGKTLQAKTGAVGEWAHDRAGKVRGAVESRPMTTAGISAGAAFIGGLAIGLLIAGRLAGLKSHSRSLSLPNDFMARARDLVPADLMSRARDLVPTDLAARIQRRF